MKPQNQDVWYLSSWCNYVHPAWTKKHCSKTDRVHIRQKIVLRLPDSEFYGRADSFFLSVLVIIAFCSCSKTLIFFSCRSSKLTNVPMLLLSTFQAAIWEWKLLKQEFDQTQTLLLPEQKYLPTSKCRTRYTLFSYIKLHPNKTVTKIMNDFVCLHNKMNCRDDFSLAFKY